MEARSLAPSAQARTGASPQPVNPAVAEARAKARAISDRHHAEQAAKKATERAQNVAQMTLGLAPPQKPDNGRLLQRPAAPAVPPVPPVADGPPAHPSVQNIDGRQKVIGQVKHIMFERDGFFIFRLAPIGSKSRSEEMTVKGHGLELAAGREVVALGDLKIENTERYGKQTIIDNAIVYEVIPTSRLGIQRLLENGYVKGIGPETARALCERFDRHLFDIAEFQPDRLYDARVAKNFQVTALINTIREKKEIPRLMSYLAEVGLGVSTSHKVLKELGPGAVDQIRKNPYVLMRVPAIGFAKADQVAQAQGAAFDSEIRVAAGIEAVLHETASKGSTFVHVPELKERMSDLLCLRDAEGNVVERIHPNRLDTIVERTLETSNMYFVRHHLVDEFAPHINPEVDPRDEPVTERAVSFTALAGAERRIATRLAAIAETGITPESRGASPSGKFFAHLSEEQKIAVRTSLGSTVSVITGRPGCGKTTVTKALVDSMRAAGLNVMLMGPTNRAAKQLTEATGQRASTLHRALGCRSFDIFEYGVNKPLECDVVIADEKSMVDTRMSDRLLAAMRPGMCMIMVGDTNQLASIAAGQVLADVIKSKQIPVSTLTEIRRTGKGSSINPNAHRVCDRQAPIPPNPGENDDFCMREVRSAWANASDAEKHKATDAQIDALIDQFQMYLDKGHRPQDIQILTPQRKKTRLGADELNRVMKDFLNPIPADPRLSVNTKGYDPKTYSVNDRIMYTSNDPDRDIYNGDIGYIKGIDHAEKLLHIDFDDNLVQIAFSELSDIDHAIVNTVHKTQGGEFPAVILVVANAHYHMLERQSMYTGMTRAKKDLCMLGDTHRLQNIVEKPGSEMRQTMLDDEIVRAFAAMRPEPSARRRMGPRP